MAYTPSEFKNYILRNRKDFIALSKVQDKELGRLYIQFAEYYIILHVLCQTNSVADDRD